MDERLIIACKFEGTSFYVFLNVDIKTLEFVVTKTVPQMNVDNMRFPFDDFAHPASPGVPQINKACQAIKAQLELYLNNTHGFLRFAEALDPRHYTLPTRFAILPDCRRSLTGVIYIGSSSAGLTGPQLSHSIFLTIQGVPLDRDEPKSHVNQTMTYYDRYGGIMYGLLLKLQEQHQQIDAEAVLTEVFCEINRILSEKNINQSLTLVEILAIFRTILQRDQVALDFCIWRGQQ